MQRVTGNIWAFHNDGEWIVIPTNGTVNGRGECVMGRGVAKDASHRFIGIARQLGDRIRAEGNIVHILQSHHIITFPVKHNWWEKANLDLIEESAEQLQNIGVDRVYLPQVGCGNGGQTWADVEPRLGCLDDRFTVVLFE